MASKTDDKSAAAKMTKDAPTASTVGGPCPACGRETGPGAIVVEPFTGLPAQPPAGKPFHPKCRPPARKAACYVCHLRASDNYDELVAADWTCANCGHEVITYAWGRSESRSKAKGKKA